MAELFDKHDRAQHEADQAAKKAVARKPAGMDAPLSRATDPQTSRDAEPDAFQLNVAQSVFLERLRWGGQMTAQEVAAGDETIRKRAKELVRAGLIIEAGVRRCKRTGKKATTYKVKQCD